VYKRQQGNSGRQTPQSHRNLKTKRNGDFK
jgi:hypothetical protein